MSSDPKLIPYILPIVEGTSVLDVGCGNGKWGYLMKVDYWYTRAGRRKVKLDYTVGVDLCPKYLNFVKHHEIYDEVVMCDSRQLPFKSSTFNTVLLLEVIEHMIKSEGAKSLREAERVANTLVIVSTPSYFIRQESRNGGLFQKHLSKWAVSDFTRFGYSILLGSFPIERIYNYLQYFFVKLTYFFPQHPVSLIAMKRISALKSVNKNQ